MKTDPSSPALPRRRLFLAGLVLTLASSTAIEVSLLLLLTSMPLEVLRVIVLFGIGGVAVGCGLLWLNRPRGNVQ